MYNITHHLEHILASLVCIKADVFIEIAYEKETRIFLT